MNWTSWNYSWQRRRCCHDLVRLLSTMMSSWPINASAKIVDPHFIGLARGHRSRNRRDLQSPGTILGQTNELQNENSTQRRSLCRRNALFRYSKKKKELCKIFFWNDKRNTIKITIWKNIYIYTISNYMMIPSWNLSSSNKNPSSYAFMFINAS